MRSSRIVGCFRRSRDMAMQELRDQTNYLHQELQRRQTELSFIQKEKDLLLDSARGESATSNRSHLNSARYSPTEMPEISEKAEMTPTPSPPPPPLPPPKITRAKTAKRRKEKEKTKPPPESSIFLTQDSVELRPAKEDTRVDNRLGDEREAEETDFEPILETTQTFNNDPDQLYAKCVDPEAGKQLDTYPCTICSRKFTRSRLAKHRRACKKSSKSRKTFNISSQRIIGDAQQYRREIESHKREVKATDWRDKSSSLQKSYPNNATFLTLSRSGRQYNLEQQAKTNSSQASEYRPRQTLHQRSSGNTHQSSSSRNKYNTPADTHTNQSRTNKWRK